MLLLRLAGLHLGLVGSAPEYFWASPRVWLSYQFNVFILVWGLELLHAVDGWLLRFRKSKVMEMEMEYEQPIVKDIVLIGAGHAHVHVLKMFGMNPEPNVRLTLITEGIDTPYSGMLPGFVSGLYNREECHIDVLKLAEFAKARVVLGKAKQVWMDSKTVELEERTSIPFDLLSINIGSSPTLPQANQELVIPVKPISQFMGQLDRIVNATGKQRRLRVAVVGGGAGGTEVALALYHRLKLAGSLQELCLVTSTNMLCPSHSKCFQELVEANIRTTTEITLMLGHQVSSVSLSSPSNDGSGVGGKKRMEFAEQPVQEFDEIIWCTQAMGAPWLAGAFDVDQQGFVKVNAKLQVNSHVFAAGDCACFGPSPLPKSGVFAVRQGPILAKNLRLAAQGQINRLVDYVPQQTFLGLLGTENGKLAMASKGEMGLAAAEWLWELKEWIDRKWMAGYGELLPTRQFPTKLVRPSLAALTLDEHEQDELCRIGNKCGGCGSKVGSSLLSKTIGKLSVANRPEVVCGLDSPDDCSLINLGGDSSSLVSTSIDYFRSMWRDEYVFGRICANHALSDVWAMGHTPVSALCMAQLPASGEKKLRQRLQRLMEGAVYELNRANCALTGGHTTEGAELVMGFSVLGTGPNQALRKSFTSSKIGSAIILTKPIGTGAIMEAHMRLQARGEWVKRALDCMLVPNQLASEVLARHGALALTDVTGFGLGGHLLEMLSGLGQEEVAEVWLDSLPLLEGAMDALESVAYTSALALSNEQSGLKRMRHGFSSEDDLLVVSLMFDPQTSGGLLAIVPPHEQAACLDELRRSGYPEAANIGEIVPRPQGCSSKVLVDIV
ncbi:pyridine nucleotide-disulfide oxidoreductase [Batrachochytrium salamandrivorans]|nr:pyridine nucleotide-disulfide oxidoreductase [Batrachochytrium salamandrivorans]